VLSLLTPVSPVPLAVVRIGLGLAALIKAAVFFPLVMRLTHPDSLVAPVFSWMPAPTQGVILAAAVAWMTAAVLFTLGWRVAFSGPVLAASMAFALLLDQQTYSNHLYLLTTLVLLTTLADAGAAFAIRSTRRPVPYWGVLLVMAQITAVYLFAALAKLNLAYLAGTVIESNLGAGLVTPPEFMMTPTALRTTAYGSVVAEFFLAIGLWIRRVRWAAVAVGIVLHTSILLLMRPVWELVVFSIIMWSTYPLFLTRGKRDEVP
jgi:hypothetical protein